MTETFVHPSAVVDPGAELAEGVKVWHFSHVSAGAVIGAGSSLGQNVFVARGVRIGAGVKIQNNVSLYEGVELEDEVFLGPSCVFTNVINPRAFIERKREYRRTRVGRGASIGANATIVCGHDIGAYAFVAAGATVTHEVPAHALVMGTPARRCGWICRCGERLAEGTLVTCRACGTRYDVAADRCALALLAPEAEPLPAVPLLDLSAQNQALEGALCAAFQRVLSSNQYILGPEVERFEAQLSAQFGFRHAIAVSSGTDALLLALMALGIGPGDEVVSSPFSFFATAGCIARVGARPVFVDIDPITFNLDVTRAEAAITERTKALLPVHLFGQTADLSALQRLSHRYGIPLIEDAAQALGASHHGAPAGSVGTFGCFSFFPSKNLSGFGDGGLLVSSDAALAERARMMRAHGAKPKYQHQLLGGNFRLDALQAALLSVKLPQLDSYVAARRKNAAFYDQRLAALAHVGVITPLAEPGHVYNQYVIRTPRRDALRAALTEARIGTEVYYPRCLHEQPCFAELGYHRGDFVEAERAASEVLALPVFPELRADQREHVVSAIERFFST